jgi:hypothetical protein
MYIITKTTTGYISYMRGGFTLNVKLSDDIKKKILAEGNRTALNGSEFMDWWEDKFKKGEFSLEVAWNQRSQSWYVSDPKGESLPEGWHLKKKIPFVTYVTYVLGGNNEEYFKVEEEKKKIDNLINDAYWVFKNFLEKEVLEESQKQREKALAEYQEKLNEFYSLFPEKMKPFLHFNYSKTQNIEIYDDKIYMYEKLRDEPSEGDTARSLGFNLEGDVVKASEAVWCYGMSGHHIRTWDITDRYQNF